MKRMLKVCAEPGTLGIFELHDRLPSFPDDLPISTGLKARFADWVYQYAKYSGLDDEDFLRCSSDIEKLDQLGIQLAMELQVELPGMIDVEYFSEGLLRALPVPKVKIEYWPCPCCNSRTIRELGSFERCNVCGWEDDPAQSEDLDRAGSNNSITLRTARERHKKELKSS